MSTVNARAFSAAQDFLLGAKKFWTTQMYPQLQEQELRLPNHYRISFGLQ